GLVVTHTRARKRSLPAVRLATTAPREGLRRSDSPLRRLSLEGQRADDLSRRGRRLVLCGGGAVGGRPAVGEGSRAAPVEVDRALGAELAHHLGKLEHGQASVDV